MFDAAQDSPPLPRPTRTRWQPLRLGLVELFHYDSEEFWFRDGHLLLRGNNGTGKSKVLSLCLPFLLDAVVSPARIEPDGDRSKRMEWNLLLGRYERRLGYSWVEFGRCTEAGQEEFFTLGCGLQAVVGRGKIDPPWYFTSELRIGEQVHLTSAERNVLTRDRLETTLGSRGRVYKNATEYRRAIDARLFRLGDRYDGLIETLIQLRQPQLSKKPDEQNLSDALNNALAELPRAVLDDVAAAMNQLDEYRDELTQIEQVREAVSDFGRRYVRYAQIQARRQARHVRQAQTEFDSISRALHETRAQLTAASDAEALHTVRTAELDLALVRQRAALDELKSDPAMTDARRLDELKQAARRAEKERDTADERALRYQRQWQEEQFDLELRDRERQAERAHVQTCERELERLAIAAGIANEHERAGPALLASEAHAAAGGQLDRDLRRALERRRAHVARIHELLQLCASANQALETAEVRANDHRASHDRAQTEARTADEALTRSSEQLLTSFRSYLGELRLLSLAEPETLLGELSEWAITLSGENPLRLPLEAAAQIAQQKLADESSRLSSERARLEREDAELAEEDAALRAGRQLSPSPMPARDPSARTSRPGAPFWQLVEFRDHVSPEERAGIEAALEGAGLLDAWVSPHADVMRDDSSDAWLTPGAPQHHSLLDWFTPGDSTDVDAVRLSALLASVAAGGTDPLESDGWISVHGEFRVGRLSGLHRKEQAQYLGRAAREAARQARLAQLAAARQALAQQLMAAQSAARDLTERQRQLNDERARAPSDEALRSAHLRFDVAERVRREAQSRLAEAETVREAAVQALLSARLVLHDDARDLRLPHEHDALIAVERALQAYETSLATIWLLIAASARSQAQWARQREREGAAAEQASAGRADAAERTREYEATCARRDLLLATVGAAIQELQLRLDAAQARVRGSEDELRVQRELVVRHAQDRARCEQRVEDSEAQLEGSAERRHTAVERLRGFAATGLLEVAVAELELPDHWTVDPALQLARRVEAQLVKVAAEDSDWERAQNDVSRDYTSLGQSLSALGQRATLEQTDFGMTVEIIYGNRAERPDRLESQLTAEAAQRRDILSAREREVLENYLQAEVAANLQRLLRIADERVARINAELKRRPTTTGVYFRLDWEPLPEGDGGAPVGLSQARERLLRRVPDAWSPEDRRVLGEFLKARIDAERAADDSGPLIEHLSRALDYRRWHRFRVKRWHDGAFRPLTGPASSGERALGLTVPLFAAASSYYETAESPHAPRLVLLDEAFAGIDDEARSHCMALIREFDLDFVMTSEREWGCYATLPGVSICQIIRREGIDGVFVSRWTWDGQAKREERDPDRRRAPEPE